MKITYIIDGLGIGGAERMLFELATRVTAEVEVIGLGRDIMQGLNDETAEDLQRAGIVVTNMPKLSKLGIGLTSQLVEHLHDTQPDIVHTHLFASDVWGARAAAHLDIPTVSTEHSVNRDEGWLKHRLKCQSHTLRDAIVAVSPAVQEYVHQMCRHNPATHVILNGVDTQRFSPDGSRMHNTAATQNARARSAKDDIPLLVVVGRLEPAKGHTNLLHALPHIQTPVHVEIIGDGSLRNDLEQLTYKLGHDDSVTFSGAQRDVADAYHRATMTVIPSNWEGQGIVALEAMASGCPVIAADVDGLRDVVDHERTGIRVDATQPEEFAAAIDALLDSTQQQRTLAKNARAEVEKRFSIDAMVAAYEDLYADILTS